MVSSHNNARQIRYQYVVNTKIINFPIYGHVYARWAGIDSMVAPINKYIEMVLRYRGL